MLFSFAHFTNRNFHTYANSIRTHRYIIYVCVHGRHYTAWPSADFCISFSISIGLGIKNHSFRNYVVHSHSQGVVSLFSGIIFSYWLSYLADGCLEAEKLLFKLYYADFKLAVWTVLFTRKMLLYCVYLFIASWWFICQHDN